MLKQFVEEKGHKIASLDIQTSWQALDKNLIDNDPITKAILNVDRRERQK